MVSCQPSSQKGHNHKLSVVTTTGMIYDAVVNVTKGLVDVEALMGPGVDPHLYKATQGDLLKLTKADLIFYNGLYLEGKMGEVLEKLNRSKTVVAITQSLDTTKLISDRSHGNYDPHVWFDVSLWAETIDDVVSGLSKIDPKNQDAYQTNATAYKIKLDSLHKKTMLDVSQIPVDKRVLITAHDAFGYFGRAYGIEVKGLQGISTLSEFGLRDINDLVDYIVEKQIKSVFVETSVSEKAIKAVIEGSRSKGHIVTLGGNLYSDAMGPLGTYEGTYVGMVSSNVTKITNALK